MVEYSAQFVSESISLSSPLLLTLLVALVEGLVDRFDNLATF